ncbi:OB-fold domain-containing protein [Streptomyces sp. NPDC048309]|uniref:Zn-ribbon domain-containing OB-fold protein n=1 Tax=Streptomyces sp. NPDC048309 TaxID=3154618 RepID=UPI0033D82744
MDATSQAPGFDVPEVDAFTRPYWDAAAQGRLLLRHCAACDRSHHYPREFCPHCWSEHVEWRPASGRATLYTWSVVHRNDLPPFGSRVPYLAAVVDLAEGPRMMTEVVECAEGALRIGMGLEVAFRAGTPVFRPTAGGAGGAGGAAGATGATGASDVPEVGGVPGVPAPSSPGCP